MPEEREVYLPPQYAVNGKLLGNPVLQLERPGYEGMASVEDYSKHGMQGKTVSIDEEGTERTVLVMPNTTKADHPVDSIFVISEAEIPESPSDLHAAPGRPKWIDPKPLRTRDITVDDLNHKPSQIRDSWEDCFHFKEERAEDGEIEEGGLRSPQIGALHATLAHWTIGSDPATVVMPTGTGKTETMLAVTVHECAGHVLVIVPTSTLRDQITDTFVGWGILKEFGILGSGAEYPVVGKLEHTLENPQQVEEYFGCCNVVVATMSVLRHCSEEVRQAICDTCSHLFIDEAHHIVAGSWERFRSRFINSGEGKPVLQFTATPYRSDGRHVAGEIIYNFPLREAQKQNYFSTINFDPVRVYRPSEQEEAIARKAIEQLEEDRGEGREHLLMARTSSIDRAKKIHAIYEDLAPDHNPKLVHSRQNQTEQREATDALLEGDSHIVTCVDMFGEGFDLPELKIAALHDIHKSLAVTIQFTGRFAREKEGLGEATVIANIADADVEDALQNLYAEDPDWNYLLQRFTEEETEEHRELSNFLDSFEDLPEALPVQNLFPKMSTVAYRTECDNWQPERISEGFTSRRKIYDEPVISREHRVAAFVTKFETSVDWGEVKGFTNLEWDLYVLYWDTDQDILYINSSNTNSIYKDLAEKLCGPGVSIFRGEQVFRVLSGINRLKFMNVGLSRAISRTLAHTMYAGANVRRGLTQAEVEDSFKSTLFGRGFEDGERASMGSSRKGRIWSYRVADDILEWTEWCQYVGAKLLDDSISVEEILENAMTVEIVEERPNKAPVSVDWSSDFYRRSQENTIFEIDGERASFLNVGIELAHHDEEDPLRFVVSTDESSVEYEVEFGDDGVDYIPQNSAVTIEVGRKSERLSEWFQEEPPIIRFADTSYLQYDEFFQVSEDRVETYDRSEIRSWNWDERGVDITTESQYDKQKENGETVLVTQTDSIQEEVIDEIQEEEYDVILDDDGKGEAADIVALRKEDRSLEVHLYHCKYSSKEDPGARVNDLYAVCGQAQRSAYRKFNVEGLLDHLESRARGRLDKYDTSRFEVGGFERLGDLQDELSLLDPVLKVSIVQPGLDVEEASEDQLDLLASTELFLREVADADLQVIGG
jgi:superfamily II DNA or RNA helicase